MNKKKLDGVNKKKYLFLQVSYSTIINLGLYYSTIARPGNKTFWCFDTKIYQHISFERPGIDALIVLLICLNANMLSNQTNLK